MSIWCYYINENGDLYEPNKYGHDNPGGDKELKRIEILIQTMIFDVLPDGLTGAIEKF